MRYAGHVAGMGEERKVSKVLAGKPEVKRPLGRPRRRWKDGIRMDLRETGWGSVEFIQLAQDSDRWRALVNAVMNPWVLVPRLVIRIAYTYTNTYTQTHKLYIHTQMHTFTHTDIRIKILVQKLSCV
jgi:hypothetical protein